jgi:hypothetical protein
MAALLALWVLCGFLGGAIGMQKGRGDEGFLLGLFLGLIGVLVAIALKPSAGHEAKRQLEIEQAKSRLAGAATPPALPASSPVQQNPMDGVVEQLRQIAELRDRGVITSDEFEASKAKLLNRI